MMRVITVTFVLNCCLGLFLSTAPAQTVEKVAFTSADDFVLRGKYFHPGKFGPGILLVHQCNRVGPPTGFEEIAPKLAENGFHVLLYDSRGFGESKNELYNDYRSQMASIDKMVQRDIEAAYEFLISNEKVDKNRIGIMGASCGTWKAIPLAKMHPEIRTLVFLSGSYLDLKAVEAAYESLVERPILAIYSEDDRYGTPASMQAAFRKSKHEASKLITYKGRLHGTPLLSHDKALSQEIVMWFRRHLSLN